MWSTRNKETLTRNKKRNYRGLGLLLIILGIFLITIGLGIFLIIIGVILLLASASSKSEGIGKSSYTTDSIMKEKEIEKSFTICPHCRQKLPLGAKFCAKCGQKVEVLKPIPPMPGKNETNSQIILDWVKYQYYDLERSIQDIADDLDISMIVIRQLIVNSPVSDLMEKKETLKPIPTVPELKIDETRTIQSISDIKEANGQINLNWLKHQYYDLGRSIQEIADELGHSMIRIRKLLYRSGIISEKEEVESITEVLPPKIEDIKPLSSSLQEKVEEAFKTCPHCRQKLPLGAKFCDICGQKVEVLKEIPLISDIEEETLKISTVEEKLPTIPVIEIKKEKRKKKPRVCKFCGMIIPKNNSFCLQCGMIIKIR